ncbi:MAG TPA: DUF6159 family protein [Acidimicrobiales bacterium]|nr:DUF6159 family protein [Acidimicrobiales bacterium]
MGRISRSMQLFSASWSVLREDKRLLIFPVIGVVATMGVVAVFAVPILLAFVHFTPTYDAFGVEQTNASMDPMGWVLTAIGYVIALYVGTFMNAALIVAANERLTGTGPGMVTSGFRGASAKAGAIFGWVLVAATVGLVLRAIEERLGLVGKLVIGLIGIAWSLLTFLVVPVLVLEHNSTGATISRSATLFKSTWGENMIGNAGFAVFTFALVISAMGLFFIGVVTGTVAGMVLMGVIAVLWLLVGSQVLAALSGIYRVALYRYAVDGQAPQAYAAFDFAGAFRAKKTSRLFSSSRSRTIHRSNPPGQPARDVWKPWTPPAQEPVDGEFGIDIPGATALPGHPAPGHAEAPPPSSSAPSQPSQSPPRPLIEGAPGGSSF